MRLHVLRLCVSGILASAVATGVSAAATLHVSPAGNDGAAGTAQAPLATLQAALGKIGADGGGEIILLDGVWTDRCRVGGSFKQPVLIRAANPGKAVIMDCFLKGASNVVIEDVRFDGREKKKAANVCQVSQCSYITLRNCDFTHGVGGHDNADPLKINQQSHHVLVENCRLFDGTDEELDILEPDVHDLVFRDNVFHHDKIRKHEASASVKWSTERVTFAGNVFANMNPEGNNGALRFGGAEKMEHRPHDLLAVDNVFIGNAGRSDLCLCGANRVLIAGNVFFASQCRGVIEATANYLKDSMRNDEFFIVNNIVAHPAGGLPTIYSKRNGVVDAFTIRNNLYFNGGRPVVAGRAGEAFFDPVGEPGALVADPLFVGPLVFEGVPHLGWKDALAVREDSPARRMRLPLEAVDMPASLEHLAGAYMRGEGDDEWYRRIRRPRERIDAGGAVHPVASPADWLIRRRQVLDGMQQVMGELPKPPARVALDVQVEKSEDLPTLTRLTITFQAGPGDRVPAYLLIPKGKAPKSCPAMLCLHGTGGARGRTAGLGPDYPRYAMELAERGYVTIAPDYTPLVDKQTDTESLGYASGTMKGIWNHIRAVDLLETIPEVDAGRIGTIGVSLGGHNSLFVAAFDERLRVAVTSSGFDSFRDYKAGDLSGWCQKLYMPRIETRYGKDAAKLPFDFPDVLAAIAPRAVYVHAPLEDDNFAVASVRRCVDEARPVFRLLGAGDRLVLVTPPGGHGFPPEDRRAAYAFIDRILAADPAPSGTRPD